MIWLVAALASAAEVRVAARGTGDPVAGATVTVGGATATTGPDGRATLPDWDGEAALTVTAEGWDTWTATVAARDKLKVFLDRGRGPLEVVVEAFRPGPDATRHVVDAEQALETPGSLEDAVRLVQSLPGVTVQREYSPSAGDLAIRGASGVDNRYYLDGIQVPYLYHYNQYASVFPASQISTLELYPSTFGSQYGNATGGVVEATSNLSRPEAVHGSAHVNFVMAGGDVRAPVGKDGWISIAGRRSFFDAAGDASAQYPVWPRFYDWSVRGGVGDQRAGTSAFVWGAGDAYTRAAGELDTLDPVEQQQSPKFDYHHGFQVYGADHRWSGSDGRGRLVAALVHYARGGVLTSNGSEDLDDLAMAVRLDDHRDLTDALGLDLGFEGRQSRTALVVADAGDDGLLVAEEAPALARGVPVDTSESRLQGGLYGTLHAQLGRLRLMPGARLSFDSLPDLALTPEPRFAAQLRLAEQTMLKAATGRYLQRPATESLLEGTGDPTLPATDSWQIAGGVEQTIAGRLELGLDGYRKWLSEPLAYPIDGVPTVLPAGQAWGIELTTRYRLREVFFVWGWAAIGRSLLETTDGELYPSNADQTLSGGLVASWDVGQWNLGARWRYASGLPYTPLVDALYDAGDDAWIPIPGDDNSARMPAYTKLDLRVARDWTFRGWELTLSAEVWYVPPPNAQLYPTWSYDYSEQGWVVGPSVLPLLGARAKF